MNATKASVGRNKAVSHAGASQTVSVSASPFPVDGTPLKAAVSARMRFARSGLHTQTPKADQ
jgi:hypothetical protein